MASPDPSPAVARVAYSTKEVALMFGVTRDQVLRWIGLEVLKGNRIEKGRKKQWFVPASEIERIRAHLEAGYLATNEKKKSKRGLLEDDG